MPVSGAGLVQRQHYIPPKTVEEVWDNFRGGLNTLFTQTEIEKNELAQMDNLFLTGKGAPTKRFGTANYFLTYSAVATDTMRTRGLKSVKFASGVSGVLELLALSDSGYLVRQNGASYTILPGFSYSSGYDGSMVQIQNRVYVSNGQNILTRYNGVTITSFTSITLPASVTATFMSGTTGTHTFNWKVSAANDVGETLATALASLANLPRSLESAFVRIAWSPASPSSLIQRYNIYGREIGFETFLSSVDNTANQFVDNGTLSPSLLGLPPTVNSTGGPVFKYMITNKDKIIGGNHDSAPSRVSWSGGGQHIDKFHWSIGGGFVDISPNDGDEIMGLIDAFDAIIVFKRRSVWQITFSVSGAIVIPNLKLLVRGIGCAAFKTIKHVENDIFFLSDRGVFAIGFEPNFTDVLRTSEISVKVRPIFRGLNEEQIGQASAIYHDTKYRISYPGPGSVTNNREIWYDRERLTWTGPMNYPATAQVYEVHRDGTNEEHLLWGDANDNYVTEYASGNINDKGEIISTALLTKKEAFKDPFLFKRVRDIFTNWRNIGGTVNVSILIEDRTGNVNVANSFTITPTSTGVGWGFDRWGAAGEWGTTLGAGSQTASTDLVRWTQLLRTARAIQLQITTTGIRDNYELLNVKYRYHLVGRGYLPQSWRT